MAAVAKKKWGQSDREKMGSETNSLYDGAQSRVQMTGLAT
jgi:hypothetical protein